MLVEKSCARYAQELLLGHGISLVLNVKPAVLRRLARATGAQVAPGADQMREQHVGCCSSFAVHAMDEELGPAAPAGSLQRTLMIFEGCPRPLCATVLLAGAAPDELFRVKRLFPWAVFAAYHLRLETALLADQLAAAGMEAAGASAAIEAAVAAAAAALVAGLPLPLHCLPLSLSPHAAIPPAGAQPTALWAAAAVRAEERLLVCLSCRSPSRRVLCEPHNMRIIEHYCATDVPLGTFLASALPGPGRRCSCGAGPETHVRGYAAGTGQLSLHVSTAEPPAGGATPTRFVWYWTGCRACAAEGSQLRGERVLLSEAALQLSLGRFLWLSLAACELRAPCGHALLQDALCFFGMAGGTACVAHSPLPRLTAAMPPRLLLPARGCTAAWVLAELREISAAAAVEWLGFRGTIQSSHTIFLEKPAGAVSPRDPPVLYSELLSAVDAEARAFSTRVDELHARALAGQPDIFAVSRLRRALASADRKWEAVVAELSSSNWRSSFPVNARRGWADSSGPASLLGEPGSSPPSPSLLTPTAPSPAASPGAHSRKGSDQLKAPPSVGRALLPLGVGGAVVVVYDEEPTSIVAYALATAQYAAALSAATNTARQAAPACPPPTDAAALAVLATAGVPWEVVASSATDSSHVRCGFEDREAQTEVARFGVTAYYAPQFAALRTLWACGGGSFLRSLARCARWDAGGGGKSGAYFAKSRDDRFVIKGLSRPELQSLLEFAPAYAAYTAAAVAESRPTLLAKLVGVFTIHTVVPGRRDAKLDVVIMENLFPAGMGPVYDLKGAVGRSRAAAGGSSVLLDENLADAHAAGDMPLAVSPGAAQALLAAVWRDTAFLARLGVMDYSLLAGALPGAGLLAVGIVDFLRQYTWDKQLETYVKASSAVLSLGAAPAEPTVVSPKQYARRFRKAMRSNIVVVPDLPHVPEEDNAVASMAKPLADLDVATP
jgi:hypothetical protein